MLVRCVMMVWERGASHDLIRIHPGPHDPQTDLRSCLHPHCLVRADKGRLIGAVIGEVLGYEVIGYKQLQRPGVCEEANLHGSCI